MRLRLISAAVYIALGVVIMFFYRTVVINIAVALIIFGALYESLVATKFVENRLLFAICAVFAVAIPFFRLQPLRIAGYPLCYLFVLTLFAFWLFHHSTLRFSQVGTAFLMTMLIAFSFTCIVMMRDLYEQHPAALGLFYILFLLIGAWMADAGGYFIGRFFGRHKMAPNVSPKKTWEGLAGGFAFSLLSLFALSVVFAAVSASHGHPLTIHYGALALLSVLVSAVSVLGDLSMSLVKREAGLKDFGNVIPGHGGVLDRFDSVMLAAPLVFLFIRVLPVLS